MLWLGQCARARIFLLIRKAITCLLAKSTREPPEATIMSSISWHSWPATQATLCASITRCQRRQSQAPSRAMSSLCTLVLMAITALSLMCRSGAITLVIVQLTMDTSMVRCTQMAISRPVLRSKTISTKRIMLLSVRRLRLNCVSGWPNSSRAFLSPIGLG